MLPLALPRLAEVRLFDTRRELASAIHGPRDRDFAVRVAESVEDAIRGADVIVTATAILAVPNPFIRHEWVKPNALVLPVDFDSAWEWNTFAAADKFVVDSIEEMEYFRSIGYLPNGLPPIHGEIGELVAGVKPGRERDNELIVDMNIGMAVQDVVVAVELFKRALASDAGRRLPT
jgi:ornithine cyclodeaminase/alanine dehydrogenase